MIKEHTIYQKSNKTNRHTRMYIHLYPKNIASPTRPKNIWRTVGKAKAKESSQQMRLSGQQLISQNFDGTWYSCGSLANLFSGATLCATGLSR